MKSYKIKTLIEPDERIPVTKEFIKKNKLSLRRSKEEILKQIEEHRNEMVDFWVAVLLDYVPFESVKHLLKEEALEKYESGECKWTVITDVEESVQDFLDYMVFAWRKAENMRGLSASRSINKLSCWAWLLGRDDVMEILEDDSLYNPYGAPALVKACKTLGIKVPNRIVKFSKTKL